MNHLFDIWVSDGHDGMYDNRYSPSPDHAT